jgi:hypothetical protein
MTPTGDHRRHGTFTAYSGFADPEINNGIPFRLAPGPLRHRIELPSQLLQILQQLALKLIPFL